MPAADVAVLMMGRGGRKGARELPASEVTAGLYCPGRKPALGLQI